MILVAEEASGCDSSLLKSRGRVVVDEVVLLVHGVVVVVGDH